MDPSKPCSQSTTDHQDHALRFFTTLYPREDLHGGQIGICQRSNMSAAWYDVLASEVERAAEYAVKLGTDVYFHCVLHDANKAGQRGNNASATKYVALWADIDLAEAGKAKHYPPGELALKKLAAMEFPPSMIVNSGNGLHGYWLLDEPVAVEDYPDLPGRFQAYLTTHLVDPDTGEAYELDPTGDDARVLRVPGTINPKATSRSPSSSTTRTVATAPRKSARRQ
jgi:hypothetical protein